MSVLRLPTWIAAATLVAGQAWIRYDANSAVATVVFVAAAAALAVSLRRDAAHRGAPGASLVACATRPGMLLSPLHSRSATMCVATGAAALGCGSYRLFTAWDGAFYLGWGLLISGTALSSAGLWLRDGPPTHRLPWRRVEVLACVAILLLGAWLRFHRLGEFPDGYTTHAIEEEQTGLGAYRLLTTSAHPWEFALDYHMTALALWLQSTPTFTTIRIPFVVISTLTIVPVHLLLRQLLSTPAALAGTYLYSVLSWNLLYSRCAHPIFPTNCLVIGVLALLVQFGRTRRLAGLPWVGLLCGYTLYAYAGFRGTSLFAAIFLAGSLVAALWRRRWPDRSVAGGGPERVARAIVVFGITLAATAAPLWPRLAGAPRNYYFESAARALANHEYYTGDPSAFIAQRLARVRAAGRILMHVGDVSPTFNYPGAPMLDPVTACLTLVGVLLMLLAPRASYNAYLLLVLGVLLAGGTIFVQNLDVRRLQGITVFVVLASAHTVEQLWASAVVASRRVRCFLACVGVAAAIFVAGFSYHLYFVRMAGDPHVKRAFKDYYTTMIRYGQERKPEHPIWLATIVHRFFDPGYEYAHNYSWLTERVLHGRTLSDIDELIDPRLPAQLNAPVTVVVQRPFEGDAAADLLTRAYPDVRCEDFIEADNPWVGLKTCTLPAAPRRTAVALTLKAEYWTRADGGGKPALTRSEPFIGYATVPAICYQPAPGQFCHARWSGVFDVPTGVASALMVETIGRTTYAVRLDDQAIERFPQPLSPGRHAIEITGQLPRDWETGVRVSLIGDGGRKVLPFY